MSCQQNAEAPRLFPARREEPRGIWRSVRQLAATLPQVRKLRSAPLGDYGAGEARLPPGLDRVVNDKLSVLEWDTICEQVQLWDPTGVFDRP
jgi:hypothetical protein